MRRPDGSAGNAKEIAMMTKAPVDFNVGDDLSDLLGSGARTQPAPASMAHVRAANPETFTERCPKCRGTGRFTSYSGRPLGDCFACKGKGSHTYKTSSTQRAGNRAKATERKERQATAAIEAFENTYQAEWAWMVERAPRFEFAGSMLDAVRKYGQLTENQMAAVRRCMARDAERDAAKAAEKAALADRAVPVADVSKVVAAIQHGKESGLKWVKLRFQGYSMSEAKNHPGTLYIKRSDGEYMGKIADNRFGPSRSCTPEDQAAIMVICADPLLAAQVYGNKTGSCCVCGKELTNKESIEGGIGPICGRRMGWTPGGIRVPVAGF